MSLPSIATAVLCLCYSLQLPSTAISNHFHCLALQQASTTTAVYCHCRLLHPLPIVAAIHCYSFPFTVIIIHYHCQCCPSQLLPNTTSIHSPPLCNQLPLTCNGTASATSAVHCHCFPSQLPSTAISRQQSERTGRTWTSYPGLYLQVHSMSACWYH